MLKSTRRTYNIQFYETPELNNQISFGAIYRGGGLSVLLRARLTNGAMCVVIAIPFIGAIQSRI